jgi:hypothetical protein
MANPFILAPQLASGKLNNENNTLVGKSATGSPVSFQSQAYHGQLGKIFVCDTAEALKLSLTSIGTLFGGGYQCVKMLLTSTQAFARGQALFWNDRANFIVTADPPAGVALGGAFAGICLNTVTRGNFSWIQIWGKANGLYATATETVVVGDPLYVVADTVGKFNNLADATAVNGLNLGNYIGRAGAIVSAAVGLIDLDWHNRVI